MSWSRWCPPLRRRRNSAYAADFFRWQEDQAVLVLDEARQTVADSSHDATPSSVNSVVLHGGAVATLVDLSKDADMIVVGARGMGAFSRALLGSVSTGLVHHAHCSVAVIHDDPPAVAADAPVLVGIDGSPASRCRRPRSPWRGIAARCTWWRYTRGATSPPCTNCPGWTSIN